MALSFCSSYPFPITEEASDFDPDTLLLPFNHDNEAEQLQFNSDGLISLSPTEDSIFPLNYELSHEYDQFPIKRQRTFDDHYCFNSPALPIPWELNNVFPDSVIPAVPDIPKFEEAEKKQSLSAQSVAARQRRRRISDKTQELGKLIPGGNKMNTAEMFQAAADYVRFLQCQVSIFQLMGESESDSAVAVDQELLRTIVTSDRIQRKLCSERSCLVPRELLVRLADRPELRFVTQEIDQLLLVKKNQ
ncbi:Transcription factor bHLH52 [Linum grandiflorum]